MKGMLCLPAVLLTGCVAGAQTFDGHRCTADCAGHAAGYEWAEQRDVDAFEDCIGSSGSFIEGCQAYVLDYHGQQIAGDRDGADRDDE